MVSLTESLHVFKTGLVTLLHSKRPKLYTILAFRILIFQSSRCSQSGYKIHCLINLHKASLHGHGGYKDYQSLSITELQ